MSKRVLAEPDALGDGSADSIYLGGKIVNKSDRMTGHPGRSDHHVVGLRFGNSRCDGSRGGQIGSGPGRSAAESAEDSVRVVLMMKREFAELDALSDGSTDAIYLADQIVSKFGRVMDHPCWRGRHVEVVGFRNPRGDEGMGGQIGSNPSEDAASSGETAKSRVPGNRGLREAPEGEGEADYHLHLGGDTGGEDDTSVGCH